MGGNAKLELQHLGWVTPTFRKNQSKPQRFERLDENLYSHYSAEDIKTTFHTTAFSSASPGLQPDLERVGQIVVTTDLVVQSSDCIA